MISIPRPPKPEDFPDQRTVELKKDAEEFYQQKTLRSQKRYKGRVIQKKSKKNIEDELRPLLLEAFQKKCVYCEQRVGSYETFALVDRFRPRRGALSMDNVESQDHYYWLAFEWENLYLCCPECNHHKGSFFPVKGERAPIECSIEEINDKEEYQLLDVCRDQPEKHIGFRTDGRLVGKTPRGKRVIDLINLNRKSLVNRRAEAGEVFRDKFDRLAEETTPISAIQTILLELKEFTEEEFLGFKRYLLRQAISGQSQSELAELKKGISKEIAEELPDEPVAMPDETEVADEPDSRSFPTTGNPVDGMPPNLEDVDSLGPPESSEMTKPERINLSKISIKNFRNITELEVSIDGVKVKEDTGETLSPWLFLLGENGSGKSSIMMAIALALAGQEVREALSLEPEHILQYGKEEGRVRVETMEGTLYELTLSKDRLMGTAQGADAYFLAYGATRLMADGENIKEMSESGKIRIQNLFSPFVGLVNASKWLLTLSDEEFDRVAIVLKDLLSIDTSSGGDLVRQDGQVFLERGDNKLVRFRALSDGYKIIIAMACDIMKAVKKSGQMDYEFVDALVMIDELGTHLHPRWKMRIVNSLRTAFPRIQFIVTSHEPLCLRGTLQGEVRVVRYDLKAEDVVLLDNLPDPSTYRIDQLLTSPFFGLHSVIEPEKEIFFNRYYELLQMAPEDQTSEEKEELKALSRQVKEYNHLGDSLREELVYFAVDKLLAKKEQHGSNHLKWDQLKSETLSSIQELWTKFDIKDKDA
ncbi:MAG: AAA family ATPase [Bacteroidota bacterium]